MKQIVMTKYGDKGVLKPKDTEDPHPGPGEVLIQVRAAGINFADIVARRGLYRDAPKPPCVPGLEVSGVVEMVGSGVASTLVGKSVLAVTRFGGYSEKVSVPVNVIFEFPDTLNFEEAAGLPVTYLTAYQLLIVMGALQRGESVLIHNAGGGVGLAALDIAKHVGAITYGTASASKHSFLKQRGLDYPIDYRKKDFLSVIEELTGGMGVELVIDPVGGESWKKSYKALRSTGRLGIYGVSTITESRTGGKLRFLKLAMQMPWFNPVRLMLANKGVFGVSLWRLWHEEEKVRGWMQEILKGVDEGWVRPHVDKVFSLEQAGEAHAYIEDRKNIGKVVLVPST